MSLKLYSHRDNASEVSDDGSTSVETCPESAPKTAKKMKAKDVRRNLRMIANVKKMSYKFGSPTDKTHGKNASVSRKISSKSRSLVKKQSNNLPGCSKSKKITNSAQMKREISMPAMRSTYNNITPLKNNGKTTKNEKNTKRNCNSLIDLRMAKNCNYLLLPPVPKGSGMLIMSPGMNFVHGVKSNSRTERINYFEQFDLLCNSHLFNQWETSTEPFFRNVKGTLSLVPKTSSTESLALRKRTYLCGIPSVKGSEHNTAEENRKGTGKTELNAKAEKSDSGDFFSSENSNPSGDNKYSYVPVSENSKWDAPSEMRLRDSSSHPALFSINEPIRLNCIDGATGQMREVLLYPDEFLKDRGDTASELDTLESIIKRSRRYNGKPLRILLDAETFTRKLNGDRKYPETTKASNSKANEKILSSHGMKAWRKTPSVSGWKSNKTPLPQDSKSYRKTPSLSGSGRKTPSQRDSKPHMENPSPRDSSNPFKHAKKSSTIPCCRKDAGNSPKSRSLNRQRTPFTQKTNPRKDPELADIHSTFNESCVSSRAVSTEHFSAKRSKDAFSKLTDLNYHTKNERKSRIALKRVNVEEILASNFRHFFHFFAALGGRLKSGAVISKQNNRVWLKHSGIIHDDYTLKTADDCFSAIARRKVVLNIRDYVQYLTTVARMRCMVLPDAMRQLMSVDIQSLANSKKNEMRTVYSADEQERPTAPHNRIGSGNSPVVSNRLNPRKS